MKKKICLLFYFILYLIILIFNLYLYVTLLIQCSFNVQRRTFQCLGRIAKYFLYNFLSHRIPPLSHINFQDSNVFSPVFLCNPSQWYPYLRTGRIVLLSTKPNLTSIVLFYDSEFHSMSEAIKALHKSRKLLLPKRLNQ